jgi:hypothetical protein
MKQSFMVSIQVMVLAASGLAVDASVLEQRIWTELRYQTMRYAAMIEPEAKWAWKQIWNLLD